MYVTMFTYGCMNVEKSLEAHTKFSLVSLVEG